MSWFEVIMRVVVPALLSAAFLWGWCKYRGVSLGELRDNPFRLFFCWLAVCAACIYGGTKGGRVLVDDPYIVDAGSALTNDICRVVIEKRSALVPDNIEILVYARENYSTNAADWVRLSPHLTFADHPFDYALPNATNYNVRVAANYVAPPSVHTNGVWQIAGFIVPGTVNKAAFKSTRIEKKESTDEE